MAPKASTVKTDNFIIPLIDFSQFLHGTASQRSETARAIVTGFQNAGFIYLTEHGIASATISEVFAQSARFFARPTAEKEELQWTTPESNRGYVAHGREKVTMATERAAIEAERARAADLKESYEIGQERNATYPNRWPTDAAGADLRRTMTHFHDECQQLHVAVMRAIAVGMGLVTTYFDGFTDDGCNTLRLLHYPAVARSVFKRNAAQVRAGAHSDYGSITLLFQDERGGLQVQSPDGNFVDAMPIANSVVVNAGDLLARWSNDTIKSTLHRVVEPPLVREREQEEARMENENQNEIIHPARYSVAYFCHPNFTAQIEAIDGTWGGVKGEKRYKGINAGDYLVQRLAATY